MPSPDDTLSQMTPGAYERLRSLKEEIDNTAPVQRMVREEEVAAIGPDLSAQIDKLGEIANEVIDSWRIRCAKQVIEDREALASWMIKRGFATGHGDTLADLIGELDAQEIERRERYWIALNALDTLIVNMEKWLREAPLEEGDQHDGFFATNMAHALDYARDARQRILLSPPPDTGG